jgi:hypothetical protein
MQMSGQPHVPPSLLHYVFDRRLGGSQAGTTNTEKKKEISVPAENRHPLFRDAFRSLVSHNTDQSVLVCKLSTIIFKFKWRKNSFYITVALYYL